MTDYDTKLYDNLWTMIFSGKNIGQKPRKTTFFGDKIKKLKNPEKREK